MPGSEAFRSQLGYMITFSESCYWKLLSPVQACDGGPACYVTSHQLANYLAHYPVITVYSKIKELIHRLMIITEAISY